MMMERFKATWKSLPHPVRWVGVAVLGVTLIVLGLAGAVLPLLPGPALIIAGLVILATEFAWARVILERVREQTKTYMERMKAYRRKSK